MKRAIVTIAATIAGIVLLLGFKTHPMPETTSTGPVAASSPTAGASRQPLSGPTATGAPATGAPATGTSTLTGTTVETQYGPVQVQVTVTGTKITDVTAIQVPSGNRRDQQINSYAIPQLTQEVLTAQSAHVDMVSGGTYTSEGYLTSLQSALDKIGIK
ncbi:FMN-binding protein [Arthrobacter sp. A2-55]|uniref:FMN-binding protein n=1 Tax=Arthrobacter sp. A2-55 TaxID=2897337 RepID=UPI0021CD70DD|nr:FMN-binding protein [Arthrobacter sp. A2-55]MCU6481183.1 FMN-binding protein [Arthrobacter sp. A2-55]